MYELNESEIANLIVRALRNTEGVLDLLMEPPDRSGDIVVVTEQGEIAIHIQKTVKVPDGFKLARKPLAERS